ncbi:uncharacterized protein LOC109859674 [Pseudomyrmex gracilis]|uniref:uncharacterized protein LOC109859674 n=1 Tax=Pseudomyrmex gracilis TaxID=219809 RepID=UPI000994DB62|nr:uncharacterized protein LOC109859674 [Pseudomyrmex gracilis]
MNVNSVEEDEDVVIKGSALYEHLLKLGYTDFESVSLPKQPYLKKTHHFNINIRRSIKQIYAKLFSCYSWITQEKNISEKQLSTILNADGLLSDHFSVINNFVTQCNNNYKRLAPQELIMTGVVLISSTCISMCKSKLLPILVTSSAICCSSYLKCIRFYANSNLTRMISLQNDLLGLCKEGLKILRRDYKMKVGFETCLSQYSQFLEDKLKHLQPLTEILVNFMEDISFLYCQCSLSIAKLLPPDSLNKESFASFEITSFKLSGEINYQSLKKLYHTYLLVQSEMLYLLAIAYNKDTWVHSSQRIPETNLAYIIHILSKTLAAHKVRLSEIITTYHTSKPEPVRYRSQHRAKWQDPSIQLDRASYKLQLAYNKVFSMFKDIDDYVAQESGIDNDTAKVLMRRLDVAFKEIDIAKSLAEFVVLLLARSGFDNLRNDNEPMTTTDDIATNQSSDLPRLIDSYPEILDEVFEEYIKEDYVEHEETNDEYSLEQQKLDRLLAKSFMTELKEALIDKHKSMSERESKALQRIYNKNTSQDPSKSANAGVNKNVVPVPPPMPSYFLWSLGTNVNCNSSSREEQISPANSNIETNNSSIREDIDESDEEIDLARARKLNYKNGVFNTLSSSEVWENNDEESRAFLPQILVETQATRFVRKLPPAFLREETFIGSGENSEDEIADNASDNEDNENNTEYKNNRKQVR